MKCIIIVLIICVINIFAKTRQLDCSKNKALPGTCHGLKDKSGRLCSLCRNSKGTYECTNATAGKTCGPNILNITVNPMRITSVLKPK